MYLPQPDIIYRPSEELDRMIMYSSVPGKAIGALRALSLDSSITDVEMRLKEVFIIDNRDPGKGDIYITTVVTDSLAPEPFRIEIKSFEDISSNTELQLGPGGFTIYRNPEGSIPRFLDYRILVMESDHKIRTAGEVLDEIRNNNQFKTLRDNLIAMATTGQPTTALVTAASDLVLGLLAKTLKMNRDDQIIYIVGSFNDKIDDLGTVYGLIPHKNNYGRVAYQVLAA